MWSRNAMDCPMLSFIHFLSRDIPGHPNEHHPRLDILGHHRLPWDVLGHPRPLGYPGISQDIPVNCCISKQSQVQQGCPRTSQDILTRGMQSQLGHPGISQDIPVNCCISKQSHVQHILLCPRMSWDIPTSDTYTCRSS